MSRAPASYIIDVCIYCGAQAKFPFTCGHRDIVLPWTMPITVVPTPATRKRVQATIDRQEAA